MLDVECEGLGSSPDENADDGTPMVGLLLASATRPLVVDEVDAGDRS